MKIKRDIKALQTQFNFITEEEKQLKIDFIGEKIKQLLSNSTLYLEKSDIFINYIQNLNTYNIHINENIVYTSTFQNIVFYIEKEFYLLNRY